MGITAYSLLLVMQASGISCTEALESVKVLIRAKADVLKKEL